MVSNINLGQTRISTGNNTGTLPGFELRLPKVKLGSATNGEFQ